MAAGLNVERGSSVQARPLTVGPARVRRSNSTSITLRMKVLEKAFLQTLARAQGCTLSAFIAGIMRQVLEQESQHLVPGRGRASVETVEALRNARGRHGRPPAPDER